MEETRFQIHKKTLLKLNLPRPQPPRGYVIPAAEGEEQIPGFKTYYVYSVRNPVDQRLPTKLDNPFIFPKTCEQEK